MTINKKLYPNVDYYQNYYNYQQPMIINFLDEHDFSKRQTLAITAIDKIMQPHNKQPLLSHVSELARIEHGIGELKPTARDHVVHAMLSYLLGIYINENFIFNLTGKRVDAFQWKLAGLFHDIGYPAQIAKDLFNSYTNKINEIKEKIGVDSQEIHFNIVPVGLEKLQNNVNSFGLFQKHLDEWELDINASTVYNKYIQSGDICHGQISALSILYIIDLLYQKNNPSRELQCPEWSQQFFYDYVVPACTAIFIHSLPNQYFENSKISLIKAPIAYLLKLSDCLQDWERPSRKNTHGFSANLYDIEVKNNKLIFSATAERKDEIAHEVMESIVTEHIDFIEIIS